MHVIDNFDRNHNDYVFKSNMLFFVQIQIKQTPETKDEFVENIPDLAILPTNSEVSNLHVMSNL
jgi:hypothetical protein